MSHGYHFSDLASCVIVYCVYWVYSRKNAQRLVAPMMYLSSIVYFIQTIILLNFFQSSSLLLVTLVQRWPANICKSGLVLFVIYSSFAITVWTNSCFFSDNFGHLSFTNLKYFCAREVTTSVTSMPSHDSNDSIASIDYSFLSIFILLSSVVVIPIPRKSNSFPTPPLCTTNVSKCPSITSSTFVITLGFIYDSLLSSIYQNIVHWFPLIIFFDTHLSYWFITKPSFPEF